MKIAKKRKSIFLTIALVLMCLYTVAFIILMGWGIIKSLQSETDFIMQGAKASSWPQIFTFDNYINAFDKINYKLPINKGGRIVYFEEMIFNSLIYSVGCAFSSLIAHTIMAYVTARYDFTFNKVIVFIVFFTMIVPIYGSLSSHIQLITDFGLMDTWLNIFMQSFSFTGMSFLIIQASFKSLSKEYGEAALIDGAGRLRIMLLVDIPLIKTTLIVLFVSGFIGNWNSYQTAMIFLPSKITASYGLFLFNQSKSSYFDYLIYKVAGFMILCIPTLILFLIFKDKMIGSLTMGGLKG